MTVSTNYIISGNGITGSTAEAVSALVSGAGNAEDLAAFIAGDNLALRYVVRDYVTPGYIF